MQIFGFDVAEMWDKYEPVFLRIGFLVVAGTFILIVGFWLINWFVRQVQKLLVKREVDTSVTGFIVSFLKIGLKVLLVLSVAGMLGVQTASFIAVFSALTLAIGLALQGNLGHFASGILLLTFRPFRVGDFVTANGYSGTVKEIQIFNTILTSLDNRLIILPNGNVMGNAIENMTAQGTRKLDLTFGISYSDDIDKARATIREVVEAAPMVEHELPLDIFVRKLNDSSVDFAVRFWTTNENFWPANFYVTEQIKKSFDKAGIGIPFPQMDVHLHREE